MKSEPLYDRAMFHNSAFESFQDLGLLCYDPAKAEVVQTIDSLSKTEEKVHNIDTPHIPFSPQGWEFGVNSPMPQADFDNITPQDMLSPKDKFGSYDMNLLSFLEGEKDNNQNQETFLDISSLPLVFGDLPSEPVTDTSSWQPTEPLEWPNTNTQYNLIYTDTQNTTPFINSDDSLDLKFGSVMPGEVEIIDLGGSEFNPSNGQQFGAMQTSTPLKRSNGGLSVDVSARAPAALWPGEISTPAILNDVISLEKEKCTDVVEASEPWLVQPAPDTFIPLKHSPKLDYEPITPQSESHVESDNEDSKSNIKKRRRPSSEDSDETYTPYSEQPARKYKRRKPSIPYKDLVIALQNQPKARRGRPPKRRESTVSSVCSVDDNSSSMSTQEYKYRELRDKNNEASKRSRMNRKLKEQEMELLAVDLEEKNKKLKVKVDILEEMTKKLKNELMAVILKK